MPRRQPGLLQVVTDIDAPAPIGGGFNVASSGAAEGAQAVGSAARGISNELGRVADKIGAMADRAAADEGQRDGLIAGMDAEFRPKRDATIYGQAYDRAAIETYGARMRIEVENDILKGGNLEEKRKAWLTKSEMPDELKPDIDGMFRSGMLAQQRKEAREAAERNAAEARASVDDEVASIRRSVQQRASLIGLDKTADDDLAPDFVRLDAVLKRTGTDGKLLVDPQQAAKIRRDLMQDATTSRIYSVFNGQQSLDAKAKFIDDLRDDFSHSRGAAAEYEIDEFERVVGHLESEYRSARAEQTAGVALIKDGVSKAIDLLENGHPVETAGLREQLSTLGAPGAKLSAELDTAERLMTFQTVARKSSPEELDAWVSSERARIAKGPADNASVQRLETGEKLLGKMRTELKQDPLGWADRTQLLAVPPIAIDSPDALAKSMSDRIARAETVAAHYGQAPKYLRPDEVRALATAASEGGGKGAAVLAAVGQAAGDKALKIFEEVGDTAPQVAWLGGLSTVRGSQGVVAEALDGIAIRKVDGKVKLHTPPLADVKTHATAVLGDVFSGRPDDEQTVLQLANAVYEIRAQRQGLVNFDPGTWKEGLREVLGETTIDGEVYGGIAASQKWWDKDASILLPPEVKRSAWSDVVGMVDAGDLDRAGLARPVGAGGKPIPMSRVADGTLVQISPYEFAVALGDPNTPGGEQWVMGADGEGFVLDFRRLVPHLRKRRPEAFR